MPGSGVCGSQRGIIARCDLDHGLFVRFVLLLGGPDVSLELLPTMAESTLWAVFKFELTEDKLMIKPTLRSLAAVLSFCLFPLLLSAQQSKAGVLSAQEIKRVLQLGVLVLLRRHVG